MRNIPLVSIIMPSFNRYNLIVDSIESVLLQTIPDWELLIVDDGSTDNTQEIVRSYAEKDSRIRFMERSIQLKGPSSCRNIAIREARADYCLFLDSDDLLSPNCLEGRLSVANKEPEVALHVFQMQFFYKQPGDTTMLFMYVDLNDALGSTLLQGSPWGISCPLWRTDVLRDLGGFDEKLQSWEDWDLHIRAFAFGHKYKVHPTIDCYCRQGLVSLTSQHSTIAHLAQRIDLFVKIGELFNKLKVPAIYKTRLAGKCLALCGELNEAGQEEMADNAWEKFNEHGVLSVRQVIMGGIYLRLRKKVFKRNSDFSTKLLRKGFSALISKDFVWGY
ncbi:MAG: glycosyl transferase family 2 [Hymenobacter sp.]|nr:glycosyl transferase family 2 [Hymenobacter sp.]